MRSAIAWLVWSVVFLLGVPVQAASERPAVSVRWSDPQGAVSPAVLELAVRDTQALFRTWGVTLHATAEEGGGAKHRIRIILLERTPLAESRTTLLGQTRRAAGWDFPAVWIIVPNVRRAVRRAGEAAVPGCVLARALSRVAAHEILHVLVPGADHASKGLMRARLDTPDLLLARVPALNEVYRRALLAAVTPDAHPVLVEPVLGHARLAVEGDAVLWSADLVKLSAWVR